MALELPVSVRGVLSRWQSEALGNQPGLRSVAADSLHVTLCFLGATPGGRVGDVVAACETVPRRMLRGLSLGEVMWLPSARRAQVLAVEIQDGHGDFLRLRSALAEALVRAGVFSPEKRAFLGHVTVARVRRGQRPAHGQLAAPRVAPFDGRLITLYRSHLGGGPARYEPLHQISLAGR